jgi:hypothetical protein
VRRGGTGCEAALALLKRGRRGGSLPGSEEEKGGGGGDGCGGYHGVGNGKRDNGDGANDERPGYQ